MEIKIIWSTIRLSIDMQLIPCIYTLIKKINDIA